MKEKMNGEHSLIVGGTKGIGRSVVDLLASQHHLVSVISRRSPSEPTVQADNVYYWTADITDIKSTLGVLGEIIKKNGKLNHLVFCQRFRGQEDNWTGEIETTLTATKRIVEYFVDRFDSNNASIVFVGSISGSLAVKYAPLAYHVAKGGLNQLAKYYAVTLGPKNIRVNCVVPGTILKENSKDFFLKNEELHTFYKKIIPLGRMGTANEVADVISFLCSSKSSFVTGQNIVIDGGVSVQWQEELATRLAAKGFKSND